MLQFEKIKKEVMASFNLSVEVIFILYIIFSHNIICYIILCYEHKISVFQEGGWSNKENTSHTCSEKKKKKDADKNLIFRCSKTGGVMMARRSEKRSGGGAEGMMKRGGGSDRDRRVYSWSSLPLMSLKGWGGGFVFLYNQQGGKAGICLCRVSPRLIHAFVGLEATDGHDV